MTLPAWWSQTVTVYHRTVSADRVAWKAQICKNCYVQRKETSVNVDTARRDGNRLVCRIPAPVPVVALGDIVYIGVDAPAINEYECGQTSADFMVAHKDAAFVISELHDNTTCPVPIKHLYIGGA